MSTAYESLRANVMASLAAPLPLRPALREPQVYVTWDHGFIVRATLWARRAITEAFETKPAYDLVDYWPREEREAGEPQPSWWPLVQRPLAVTSPDPED